MRQGVDRYHLTVTPFRQREADGSFRTIDVYVSILAERLSDLLACQMVAACFGEGMVLSCRSMDSARESHR